MNIYICIPSKPSQDILVRIRANLAEQLKKYYGMFPANDVRFFVCPDSLSVYVMESARYSGYDREITQVIKSVVNEYFPSFEAEIALNYQKLNPEFNPYETFKKKSAVSEKKSVSDSKESASKSEEFDYDKLSENYHAEEPRYSFEQVILPETLKNQINEAVSTVLVEHKVFDEWGLRTIIPNASSALSFYGPPGTGKSMAAEAIAQKLGKKILRATYADIESKFHGEGPKMVKAIFRAAERDDAVLFLDESDSLLSKRLTNVTDGSSQAINSMRSQLLICLEQFKGIVIFATNLVVNYDKAFLSRLINIEFTKPDKEARYSIWYQHLKGKGLRIPLSDDVDINELAEKYEFCGREIKNSVKDACVITAISESEFVSQETLVKAAEKTKIEYEKVMSAEDHTVVKKELNEEQKNALKEALQKKIDESKTVKADEI
ncbi:MAG: ATP-binding protein [Ruminococcus sp.]|nr:ATP-binding protein [Ruminococcus sp.]